MDDTLRVSKIFPEFEKAQFFPGAEAIVLDHNRDEFP